MSEDNIRSFIDLSIKSSDNLIKSDSILSSIARFMKIMKNNERVGIDIFSGVKANDLIKSHGVGSLDLIANSNYEDVDYSGRSTLKDGNKHDREAIRKIIYFADEIYNKDNTLTASELNELKEQLNHAYDYIPFIKSFNSDDHKVITDNQKRIEIESSFDKFRSLKNMLNDKDRFQMFQYNSADKSMMDVISRAKEAHKELKKEHLRIERDIDFLYKLNDEDRTIMAYSALFNDLKEYYSDPDAAAIKLIAHADKLSDRPLISDMIAPIKRTLSGVPSGYGEVHHTSLINKCKKAFTADGPYANICDEIKNKSEELATIASIPNEKLVNKAMGLLREKANRIKDNLNLYENNNVLGNNNNVTKLLEVNSDGKLTEKPIVSVARIKYIQDKIKDNKITSDVIDEFNEGNYGITLSNSYSEPNNLGALMDKIMSKEHNLIKANNPDIEEYKMLDTTLSRLEDGANIVAFVKATNGLNEENKQISLLNTHIKFSAANPNIT